ncbi:MAG: hypothetical protein IPL21_08740 [Saprospirales bacterium]|nr:hypothetical protein [Saprospirales bacterium]
MQFQRYTLIYKSQEQINRIESADFSVFENQDLKIEFLLEDAEDGKRYQTVVQQKNKIELVDFFIETKIDYSNTNDIFCNGFQSWTETKLFNKTEKLKAQRRGIKAIGEAYGDGLFYSYKNKKA